MVECLYPNALGKPQKCTPTCPNYGTLDDLEQGYPKFDREAARKLFRRACQRGEKTLGKKDIQNDHQK